MAVHIFGIRHHGPGSARSLVAALNELVPDVVLIEGPPDANALIPLAGGDDMRPPVALLLYENDNLQRAVYYPFAVFSPEWQAMVWANAVGAGVRFMDLAAAHQFALADDTPAISDDDTPADDFAEQIKRDPLSWLGRAAGYDDGERWWEQLIEQRRDNLRDVFPAVLEAMTALRETVGLDLPHREALREATMRTAIRAAQAAGHETIAVVCGAWHGPALVEGSPLYRDAEHDAALLADLSRVDVTCAWIPWTYGRLSRESGYGAGIASPGWYHHLWETRDHIAVRWLTHVAEVLRENGLDASTAQVIDAARLAESVAAMRGQPLVNLDDLNEATQATMTFGRSEPMAFVREQLMVSDRLGTVSRDAGLPPLQHDLEAQVRALASSPRTSKTNGRYFNLSPNSTELKLDTREDKDLQRSVLLHRLNVLGVAWGRLEYSGGRGTNRENWRIQWRPEYVVTLIERSVWGNTVEGAASAMLIDFARTDTHLAQVTQHMDAALHADLIDTLPPLIARMRALAVAASIPDMLAALEPLVGLKSGHHRTLAVRNVTLTDVSDIIDSLIVRVKVGLPGACANIANDLAEQLHEQLISAHGAIMRLHNADHITTWQHTLAQLISDKHVNPLIAGRAARLLLDTNVITIDEAADIMRRAVSTATDPTHATAWIDGFLRNSGLILLHDPMLLDVVEHWLIALDEDKFVAMLPLLRRTFATFAGPERHRIGELIRQRVRNATPSDDTPNPSPDHDTQPADDVLPLLAALLGLEE